MGQTRRGAVECTSAYEDLCETLDIVAKVERFVYGMVEPARLGISSLGPRI